MTWEHKGVTIADPAQIVLEAEPYRRLAYTWQTVTREFAQTVGFNDEFLARVAAECHSKASFDIQPRGTEVKLTVIHDDFEPGSAMLEASAAAGPCKGSPKKRRYRGMSAEPRLAESELTASADDAAASALRELPEALILVFDRELRFILAAGQALERHGHPPTCREGQQMADAFPSGLWQSIEPLCRSALAGETRSREIWTTEYERCVMIDVGPLRSDGEHPGEISGGVAVILDITTRRQTDALLHHSQDHFEQVFERAPIGMGLLDQEGRWVLVNRALCEITGYTSEELIERRIQDITHPDEVDGDALGRARLLAGEIPAFQRETRYFNAAGDAMSAIISISLVRDHDGAPLHFIAQLQDISERKRLEEHLRHLADHDPLTGLRNRRLFEHDLKLQVARSHRYGEMAALMVIDLDAFKQINDLHGHKAGDDTLRAVAKSLTRRLRETDLVARLGGDEFAVLLPHIDGEGAQTVADSLRRAIAACSIDVGETALHPSASVGFAMIEPRSGNEEQVLVEADRAMYAAKHAAVTARSSA